MSPNRGWVEIERLVAAVGRWEPAFLAFTAKGTAAYAARALGHRAPGLGLASWGIGRSEVFVLPGTSGANQRKDYDGRPNRLAWWTELAGLAALSSARGRRVGDVVVARVGILSRRLLRVLSVVVVHRVDRAFRHGTKYPPGVVRHAGPTWSRRPPYPSDLRKRAGVTQIKMTRPRPCVASAAAYCHHYI
jgi:hypothetical protein